MHEMKWCQHCRSVVEAVRSPISSTMDLLKCSKCGKTLGQVSAGMIIWFSD